MKRVVRHTSSLALLALLLATSVPLPAGADTGRSSNAPPLVVELGWTLSPDELATLLASCEAAYAAGTCRTDTSSQGASLWARVERQTDDDVVVELHVTEGSTRRDVSRELSFHEEDDASERAKAIGLTLGVVAAGLIDSHDDAALGAASTIGERGRDESFGTSARLSLLLGVGRDPELSTFEVAGAARLQLRPRQEGLELRGGVDGSRASLEHGTLTLTRLTPTVGLGFGFDATPWDFAVAVDGGAEWLTARAVDLDSSEVASRWSPLLRGSLTAAVALTPHFGLTASAQLSWTASPTTAFVRGAAVARTSAFVPALLAGFYVRFGPS